jgi:DNA invertase Pin-like site-specific DNA recombinase
MIYAYIRVSSEYQTVENQRFELENYCKQKRIAIDEWFEETISGAKQVSKRELQKLFNKLKEGDIILTSELSRLSRKLVDILVFLENVMKVNAKVITVRENYELGDSITSKVLAFAFGLSAEIERKLISQRTKEGLGRLKAKGMVLGRPKGTLTTKESICDKKKSEILKYLDNKISISAIARLVGVHRITLSIWVDRNVKNPETRVIINKGEYHKQKVDSAKMDVLKIMPNFKSGDIDYLKSNIDLFLKVKNNGYSYSNLSEALGISSEVLKNLMFT